MTFSQIDAIAREYQAALHVPAHPSYQAFVRETVAQWRALGPMFIVYSSARYKTPEIFERLTRRDVYISPDGNMMHGHPLANSYKSIITYNDLFRAVHDYYGHYVERNPIETFEGEIRAYLAHARRYSALARPALYSETIGQLCHYYSGRGFVTPQKACILEVRF